VLAQNLGTAPQFNVAVQGQTGAQPEGAFLNFFNWVGNVIAPVGAIARMNGGRGIPETLAQKRLFFGGLPAMAGENKRELDLLTLHAADLCPVEMPWRGTPNSPLMLFETPHRQLIPFSPFDSSLGDANLLIMAKSGVRPAFLSTRPVRLGSI